MNRSLTPAKKAEVLRALAAGLNAPDVLRSEEIEAAQLRGLLLEAAGFFAPQTRDSASLVINIDGASRNNPGHSGAGVVVRDTTGRVILEEALYLGIGTNNEAEYKALLLALEKARGLNGQEIVIRSDSELLVNQINGTYKVREPRLQSLYVKAIGMMEHFSAVKVIHVPRKENSHADKLANRALDDYISTSRGI